MKRLSLAARAVTFAVAVSLPPAAAQTTAPESSRGSTVPQTAYAAPSQYAIGTAHWEWQYHYGGRHARYEGHWVLVR